jgi:fructose-1,6-bisphosphatase/inositol monophosphatase family enzyme
VLLTTESGGRCTTFEGQPYAVISPRCAATNGRIHQELLDALHGE